MSDVKKIATRDSYGNALVELGKEHEEIVVLDADLAGSTKTGVFGKAFPERHFNAGIAEAKRRGRKSGRKFKYSNEEIDTMQHLIKAGVPKAEVARRFKTTNKTIFNYFTPDGEIKQRG